MLAELAAANAAYGIIKGFISNGKELSGCAKQISDFVLAQEDDDLSRQTRTLARLAKVSSRSKKV
jgi:hypothetical protein